MGDTAVVDGIGGVGILVVQAAAHAGARVIAIGDSEEKLDLASAWRERRRLVDTRDLRDLPERVRALTDGRGTDVFFEFVGTTQTMNGGIRSLAKGGRFVSTGYTDQPLEIHPIEFILSGDLVRLHGRRDASRPAGRAHARGGGCADGARSQALSARWDRRRAGCPARTCGPRAPGARVHGAERRKEAKRWHRRSPTTRSRSSTGRSVCTSTERSSRPTARSRRSTRRRGQTLASRRSRPTRGRRRGRGRGSRLRRVAFTPATQRARLIWTLADLLEANKTSSRRSRSSTTASRCGRRRPSTSRSRSSSSATTPAGRRRSTARSFRTRSRDVHRAKREPVGVVAAITPWNFPLLEVEYKLGPAVAAGAPS